MERDRPTGEYKWWRVWMIIAWQAYYLRLTIAQKGPLIKTPMTICEKTGSYFSFYVSLADVLLDLGASRPNYLCVC